LHEQFVGIVQDSNGRRGASRNKYGLPAACIAAAQHMMLGAIETERKSMAAFTRLRIAIGVGFFAARSREILSSSLPNTLIMATFR
jgi:hypothetical protein